MSELKNSRLINALLRKPVDVTPVWIMRQAGRYLPEYRKTRERAGSFINLCKTPELACEVTLQPLLRFPLDAAILFSDILTIPDAMGLGLSVIEKQGPVFEKTIRTPSDVDKLAVPDPEIELRYVMDAIRIINQELDGKVPLIGFAGSPWTIATYMIEGQSSKEFSHAKGMLYQDPHTLHRLLDVLAKSITLYLKAQISAGVNVVMLFDSWGGALSSSTYNEFSLRYMKEIVEGLKQDPDTSTVPVILFTKGGGLWIEDTTASGCDAIGIDWCTNIGDARRKVGDKVAIQGNLDTAVLYAKPDKIREEVGKVLESYGHGDGHVFNLGHGIHPEINPDHVAALVEAVHSLSRQYHK
jgi:uroporphyrinogen decarboxylase